jgi:MoaA/NifB/PqqE/SkfB family radical SAM enzyme
MENLKSAAKGGFLPLLAYLGVEWKCDMLCHSCRAYNSDVKEMHEDTARRAIEWLAASGNRLLVLTGSEVLRRPKFVQMVVDEASRKGLKVRVPTNGRLLSKDLIDQLGEAGVAAIYLTAESASDLEQIARVLQRARPCFDYLLEKKITYGFQVGLQINLSRIGEAEVKRWAEIAHEEGIPADYYVNQSCTGEAGSRFDPLIGWLLDRKRLGYRMANSATGLLEMRAVLRGEGSCRECGAGREMVVIRTDGSLAPCLPLSGSAGDWGEAGNPSLDPARLEEIKGTCRRGCRCTLDQGLLSWQRASGSNGTQRSA